MISDYLILNNQIYHGHDELKVLLTGSLSNRFSLKGRKYPFLGFVCKPVDHALCNPGVCS